MDTKTFLSSVLGDSGYYCVFAARLSDERRVQKFYDNLDAAISAAQNMDSEGFDAYYALGTFDEAGSRKAPNVRQLRSFFLDLDCGPTKEYGDKTTALQALRGFCRDYKFPRPTIIDSGRGIHAYWPLAIPVSRDQWTPAAEQFKSVCKQAKLHSDPAVTADSARVLRVPGTHNYKDNPPKEVRIVGELGKPVLFDDFLALLPAVITSKATPKVAAYNNHFSPLTQVLAGNYTSNFSTIVAKSREGKGCAHILDIIDNQETVSEPLWRAGLSIAKFCEDGGAEVHRISEKHPEYSYEATEEKVALIKGPYLCSTFDEFKPGICENCELKGHFKSPIVIGKEVQEADEDDNVVVQKLADVPEAKATTFVIPKYPSPYFRGKSGGVFKRTKDKEGGDVDALVYLNDLYVVRRLQDAELGECIVLRLHLPKDGIREFTLPLSVVGARDEFRKSLATHGVAVLNTQELAEYTMRWVNELQFSTETSEAHRQFGWTDEEGTCFILGNKAIYKDRIELNPPSSTTAQFFPHFRTKGTLEEWKKTMEFFNRPGFELHQFMIGISFGAVLMEFQALNAAAFHVHSKGSGLGKTTALYAGNSIWGNPSGLTLEDRDTYMSKMNRAEVYKNLMVGIDEMTNTKPEDLSNYAYQLPSGYQRNRMSGKSNVERLRGKPWKTLFCTTGNVSLLERIGSWKSLPRAEAMRILEWKAVPMEFSTKEETDAFYAAIQQNYGHAGPIYLQYVMNNLENVIEVVKTTQKKIDTASGMKAEHRFWSVAISHAITGLMVAKKAGLLDWKIQPIVAWVLNVIAASKNTVYEMSADVEVVLANYLAENYTNILRIKSTDDARMKGKPMGLDVLQQPEATPRISLIGRYEYDKKLLYLLPKPFRDWCVKSQLNFGALVEDLKTGKTQARKEKMRLSRGTHMNLPPTDVLVIDCKDFMDEETEQTLAATATTA